MRQPAPTTSAIRWTLGAATTPELIAINGVVLFSRSLARVRAIDPSALDRAVARLADRLSTKLVLTFLDSCTKTIETLREKKLDRWNPKECEQ